MGEMGGGGLARALPAIHSEPQNHSLTSQGETKKRTRYVTTSSLRLTTLSKCTSLSRQPLASLPPSLSLSPSRSVNQVPCMANGSERGFMRTCWLATAIVHRAVPLLKESQRQSWNLERGPLSPFQVRARVATLQEQLADRQAMASAMASASAAASASRRSVSSPSAASAARGSPAVLHCRAPEADAAMQRVWETHEVKKLRRSASQFQIRGPCEHVVRSAVNRGLCIA